MIEPLVFINLLDYKLSSKNKFKCDISDFLHFSTQLSDIIIFNFQNVNGQTNITEKVSKITQG